MSTGIRIASVDDIPAGEGIAIERSVAGTEDDIAILRDDDGCFYALDDTCTHEEASLADGWVENGQVECPLHAGKFCLKTGEVLSMPATRSTRTHRIEVRDGEVWLHPAETPVS
jgi:3-phenylpropionate/trans-cinnamate dioxygenase ferredoxin subunit